jgi:hypothetical protein
METTMDISRRNILRTAPAIVGGSLLASTALLEEGCSASTADDITLVIGAAEGVLDIFLPDIPGGSALVPVATAIGNALSQVTTIWGSSATTSSKWSQMLAILETIPGQILTLSPTLQAIISGVGAAVNVIIGVIQQLQGGTAAANARVVTAPAVSLVGAPNARAVAGLLSAIAATQKKLAKL